MRMNVLTAVALASAVSLASPGAQAQTVEGAHAFLAEATTRGSTRVSWFPVEDQPGTVVTRWTGSGCRSEVTLASGVTVPIDWSTVSKVDTLDYGKALAISSARFPVYASGVNRFWAVMESPETVTRAMKAADFLRTACDTLAKTGF